MTWRKKFDIGIINVRLMYMYIYDTLEPCQHWAEHAGKLDRITSVVPRNAKTHDENSVKPMLQLRLSTPLD